MKRTLSLSLALICLLSGFSFQPSALLSAPAIYVPFRWRVQLGRAADQTLSIDRNETLAIEPKVEVELRGQSYVGFIDRLARDPSTGRMRIIDYKTGKRMPASIERITNAASSPHSI